MSHKTLYNPEVFMMRPEQTSEDWEPVSKIKGTSATQTQHSETFYTTCALTGINTFLTELSTFSDIRSVEELFQSTVFQSVHFEMKKKTLNK